MYMTLEPAHIDETLSTLQTLAEACSRSETGFRTCAEHARADDVRALLRRRAEECKTSAAELGAHLHRLGSAALPQAGTTADSLGWTVVRATLSSYSDQALLEECERGEDALLERYTDALTRPLEPAAKEVLATQRMETRQQHELLRAMRDRLRGLE